MYAPFSSSGVCCACMFVVRVCGACVRACVLQLTPVVVQKQKCSTTARAARDCLRHRVPAALAADLKLSVENSLGSHAVWVFAQPYSSPTAAHTHSSIRQQCTMDVLGNIYILPSIFYTCTSTYTAVMYFVQSTS